MKKIIFGLLGGVLFVLLLGIPVLAGPWQLSGGERIIRKGHVVEGDLIFSGDQLEVEGEIKGDLLVFAREVSISGRVEGSILGLVWEKFSLQGTVERDLRVLANELNLSGMVKRSLTAGAVKIYTSPDSQVGTGILGYCSELKLEGQVEGPVEVDSYGLTKIGGRIAGDLKVSGAQVEWLPPVEVGGKVTDLTGITSPPVQNGVKIGGEYRIQREKIDPQKEFFKWAAFVSLVWLLGNLLISLIFYRLFPRTSWIMSEPTTVNFRGSLAIGLLGFIVIPVVILILILTVVGIPLAILLGLFYLMLLFFSGVPLNLWFGRLIFKSRLHPSLLIVFGGLFLMLLSSIPWAGFMVQAVVMIMGFGVILRNVKIQYKDPQVNIRI